MYFTDSGFSDLDARQYPVVVFSLTNVAPTDKQMDTFLNQMRKVLDQTSGPYIIIAPLPNQFLSARVVQKCVNILSTLIDEYPGRMIGSVTVASSPITRQVMKIFLPLISHKMKNWVVSSMEGALVKAKTLVEEHLETI